MGSERVRERKKGTYGVRGRARAANFGGLKSQFIIFTFKVCLQLKKALNKQNMDKIASDISLNVVLIFLSRKYSGIDPYFIS